MNIKNISKKAFTLVELLIVIAILGILAVGLLIALDPVEQTRRATDATVLRSAADVKGAIERFYTGKLYFPWCTSASPAGGCALDTTICATAATAYLLNTGCGTGVLSQLTGTGELKATLPPSMTGVITLGIGGGGTSYTISFNPVSKSYDVNTNTKYTDSLCTTLGTGTTCTTAGNSCYFCL